MGHLDLLNSLKKEVEEMMPDTLMPQHGHFAV